MHFAGLKAVGESVQKPLEYYRVNLTGTIRLLEVSRAGRQRVVLGAARALGVILLWGGCAGRQLVPAVLPKPCPRGVTLPAWWELPPAEGRAARLSWRTQSLLAQRRLVPAPQTMKAHGVRNIVFSSSATVYGDPRYLPLDENHPVGGCTNPYGKSKYFIEEMIQDLCKAERVRSCPKARGAGN